MKTIKAIETEYNGYRFRSRAEARWAVFFDACKMKYQYEPEGFILSDGTMYLPDFYLPESKTYVEVKGLMSETDYHKIIQLQYDLDCSVVICYPDMTFQASSVFGCGEKEDGGGYVITEKGNSWFCKCKKCNKYYFIGVEGSWRCQNCYYYDGNSGFEVISEGDSGGKLFWGFDRDYILYPNPFDVAKQARFEHGEKPRV